MLNKLILKSIIYVLIMMVLLTALCLLSRNATTRMLESRVFNFKENVTLVVCGDSHPATALNPDFLPDSINIAKPSENYFFTLNKLKFFLNRNKNVKFVVLGFSYHNINKNREHFIHDIDFVDKYYHIVDRKDTVNILHSKFPSYIYLKNEINMPVDIYKDNIFIKYLSGDKISREDISFYGQYYGSAGTTIDFIDFGSRINEHYTNGGFYSGKSELLVNNLARIIDYCNSAGVKVILYNSPLYPEYKYKIPAQAVADFELTKNSILKRYGNVLYIDHSQLPLTKYNYGDADHVNYSGALITTKTFVQELDRYKQLLLSTQQ